MGQKRKRPVKDDPKREKPSKQQPTSRSSLPFNPNGNLASDTAEISHPVISLYYRQVVTLRQYILQRIPRSSKSRRRRIAAVRADKTQEDSSFKPSPSVRALANLLDTTLVGIWKELSPIHSKERRQDFVVFTQAQLTTQNGTDTGPTSPQSEIVNFVISSIFTRGGICNAYGGPDHILSHGFQQASGLMPCSIPNVDVKYPNKNVQTLKQSPWTDVLALLGNNGDEIMLKLLLDCGLFVAIDVKKGVYCQISGLPLTSLKTIATSPQEDPVLGKEISNKDDISPAPKIKSCSGTKRQTGKEHNNQLSANAIIFHRKRILYARPHLDANGRIVVGLPKHVLTQFLSSQSFQQTVHVMKYIFPQQFGLHNVFTFKSGKRENAASVLYKDYSSREEEIGRKKAVNPIQQQRRASRANGAATERQELVKIPKRLRGKVLELIHQLQNRSKRCCFSRLLRYYCPEQFSDPFPLGSISAELEASASGFGSASSAQLKTQLANIRPSIQSLLSGNEPSKIRRRAKPMASKPKVNLTDYATPTAAVSAFCRAVIQRLIPPEFFGKGEQGVAHWKIVLSHIDRFVRMRRHETLSLHEVCSGIKITQIPWLEPESSRTTPLQNKISASDLQKRQELFHEFLYYLFDSILVPLIRGNFYVTESQAHRQRLFYFRHDLWRRLTAQPLASLKASMFDELRAIDAEALLGPGENLRNKKLRSLGYGSLRMLPKATGIRPILNLKRKSKFAGQKGAQSVNSILSPVYNMLNYEKGRRCDLLGSSMYSVGDMHARLKGFKGSLVTRGWNEKTPLYFVKLDIQSCFDTIPQLELVRLIETLVSEEEYHWIKYAEVRPRNEFGGMWSAQQWEKSKVQRKFLERVAPMAKPEHLADAFTNGRVSGRRNTVLIDTLAQREYSGERLLDVLNEHVRDNLVKIGKKFFRQRNGIPQGSVMSALLCNLFYAEMERQELGFLQRDDALLLRLTDDFLLVTVDPDLAMRFLQAMLEGQPAYGISVNPAKSLVNFAASVNGAQIPRLVNSPHLPYCGCLINTRTLEISKDQDRMLDGAESASAAISNTLTTESTRAPGRAFHRKVLASIKQSMSSMYIDTSHNSLPTVLLNLYKALVVVAMKMHSYTKSLPARAHPRPEVVVRTIRDATELACRLIRGRRELCSCTVSQTQLQYLGAAAFQFVLGRKQSRYAEVVCWLDGTIAEVRQRAGNNGALLAQVVRRGNAAYGGWRF